jgi:transposase
MARPGSYPPQLRALAITKVAEIATDDRSRWAAIKTVASELGIGTETLRTWIRDTQHATPPAADTPATPHAENLAELDRLGRENAQLRRALDLFRRTDR